VLPAEEEFEGVGSESDASSSDFHEIITSSSDAETIVTSDEDDANLLEAFLGSAFSCDPSLLKKNERNAPSSRNSLLFLDKDLLDDEMKEGKCVTVCVCVPYGASCQ
jgi:hypothetical protein